MFSARSRAFHPARLRREDDFGAEGTHGLAPFNRQVLGHDQHHAVPTHRRRHGERDAGVAAGRFDQGIAGPDLAAPLGAHDHRQRGAVLDRSGRVVALELGQNDVAASVIGSAGDALQTHQRRMPMVSSILG
jgi:hypothetical protein